MPFDLLATVIRYAMMVYAGHLVTKGVIDASMIEPLAGLAVALGAFFWYWLGKWRPGRFRGDC